ncbi:hypothetical protein [Novosphingobium sp.]|uniref:hypothetical protein n=1 Tax=Novosphingobium sp. TaxID=1874826 RepID=UPI0038B968CA
MVETSRKRLVCGVDPAQASQDEPEPESKRLNVRTRLSICMRKRRFATVEAAEQAAQGFDESLRSYRCDRCHAFHLTSRRKGKRISRPTD